LLIGEDEMSTRLREIPSIHPSLIIK